LCLSPFFRADDRCLTPITVYFYSYSYYLLSPFRAKKWRTKSVPTCTWSARQRLGRVCRMCLSTPPAPLSCTRRRGPRPASFSKALEPCEFLFPVKNLLLFSSSFLSLFFFLFFSLISKIQCLQLPPLLFGSSPLLLPPCYSFPPQNNKKEKRKKKKKKNFVVI